MFNICGKHDFPFGKNKVIHKTKNHHQHKIYGNILETIGDTPLVRLNRIPKDHGLECEIFVKCEFLCPGGSIKDRIGYTMMLDAEKSGRARNGTMFIEPTSGNTGIGVALAAAVHGYDCTIVTPNKNSDEKMNTMGLLGAKIVQTPANVTCDDPESYISVAKKLLKENPDAISLDQYNNDINPLTHYEHTAEEILDALESIDLIVLGTGTGGTLSGVAHRVKQKCPKCIVVAVDPVGSTMFGEAISSPYFIEGIGGDFVPHVLDKSAVDIVENPNDCQAFNMARELIGKEGLLCGGSSGAAMFSAVKAARDLRLGREHNVVVILPDGIRNYMTKFVSDQWMEAHLFKNPPVHKNILWWNQPITSLKVDICVPRVKNNDSCLDAVAVMGDVHKICIVIDDHGYFVGAISKDSLRHLATNPKNNKNFNLNDPVKNHLIKNCYKLIQNEGKPTVGLASRILDITPFVVVVQKCIDNHTKKEVLLPKGIITADIIFDYIIINM